MASELNPIWDSNGVLAPFTEPPPDDAVSDAGRSTKSTRSNPNAKAKAAGRAPRGKATMLSSSFTCWKVTPET